MMMLGVFALIALFFGADHLSQLLGIQTGHVVFSVTCFAVSGWLWILAANQPDSDD
jgi:hypothetical protein